MPTYDANITKVPKPTAATTVVEKPTASYTITPKTTASYTVTPKPYTEPLAILTEDSVEILYESEIVMVVQGAL